VGRAIPSATSPTSASARTSSASTSIWTSARANPTRSRSGRTCTATR
jgi:hypothetical protein